MINHLSKIVSLLFLLLLIFSTLTCKKSPIEPETSGVVLSLEDVTCTEMWGKLRYYEISPPVEANIYLNDKKIKSYTLTTNDTIIYIDSLLPKRQYNLYIELTDAKRTRKSNILKFETMDTTSRNFTWQVFEFGECSNSVLFDVAIIDENDIWAVGAIYMRDSLGRCDPNAYNAIHWNGQKWELKRIYYKSGFWTIRTIYAFDKNDIWFSGYIRFFNGRFIELPIPDILIGWGINKLWGTSSSDLYAVGNHGNIAHWDGVRWRKIESGTDVPLVDIYGNNLSNDIYIIGYDVSPPGRSVLLRLKDGKATKVWEWVNINNFEQKEPYGTYITSLYIKDNILYIHGTRGIFKENIKLGTKPKKITEILFDWVYEFKGSDKNNIFTFSDLEEIFHYNGVNFKRVLKLYASNYNFYGGRAKDNIVVGVGVNYKDIYDNPAFLVLGRRN